MSIMSRIAGYIKDAFVSDAKTAGLLVDTTGSAIRPNAGYPGMWPHTGTHWGMAGNDGSKFPGGLSASGSSPFLNQRVIRQNARSAYHDSIHARALIDRTVDVTVDTGLKLEPDPDTEILSITPEAAREWSEQVGNRFHLWAKTKKVTRSEDQNLYQLQRLVGIGQHRDNDGFVRFFYSGNRKDLINPLQLQVIDPNQINGTGFTDTAGFQYDTANAVDGIERNAAGKETAYHVFVQRIDGTYESVRVPAQGPKSKKTLMVHIFVPEYAGQGRGYSRIGHALQEFQNLTDFSLSEILKAIGQSAITMVNKPSNDAPASNPLEDITKHVAGPMPDITATPTPEEVASADSYLSYRPMPEATIKVPGSVSVFNLEKGEDLVPFKSTAPSENFSTFIDAFMSYLCASVSMPVEVLKMQFGESYSASRASLILLWRIAEIHRNELISDFLDPVYESWLSGEIAAGRISAPGWQDPVMRQAWLCNNWYGAPMPNIDPLRTMEADKGYAEIGATDLDRLAREHNGSNGTLNRFKLDKQYAELPVPPWSKKAESRGSNQQEDTDGGEDE